MELARQQSLLKCPEIWQFLILTSFFFFFNFLSFFENQNIKTFFFLKIFFFSVKMSKSFFFFLRKQKKIISLLFEAINSVVNVKEIHFSKGIFSAGTKGCWFGGECHSLNPKKKNETTPLCTNFIHHFEILFLSKSHIHKSAQFCLTSSS